MSSEYSDFQQNRYIQSLLTAPTYSSGGGYLSSPYTYKCGGSANNIYPSGVERMLGAKISRSDERIETLIEAIDKRRLIKEVNLYGIEKDLCTCQNLLFEMGYKIYRRDRDWIQLETRKIDLERDRRMEQAAYFRDLTLLGKELRDTVEYRQSILDKAQMLGGNMIQNEIQL